MHRFEYRLPRHTVGFSVDFAFGEEILHGVCRDVSDAGIRAVFDGLAVVGVTGLLILRHQTCLLKLKAEIAYVEGQQVGLSFLFQGEQDRAITIQFLRSIAKHSGSSELVPFG